MGIMTEKNEKPYLSNNAQFGRKTGIRKTHQEFCTELIQLNPQIPPLEEYVSAYTKIKFRCEECGNEWVTAPTNIISKNMSVLSAQENTEHQREQNLTKFSCRR